VVSYLSNLDLDLCLRVNALGRREWIRRFFSTISWLGDWPAWLLFGLAIAVRHGASGLYFAMQAALTACAGIAVYKFLKQRLERERPFVTHGEVFCGTAPLDRYSFPSGHTLHAVAFAILYGAHEPRMLLLVGPFAILVAASRMVLGLHYPSDVLVGGVIGAVLATVSLGLAG